MTSGTASPDPHSRPGGLRAVALAWVDALTHAAAVAAIATLAALVVGIATGGGLVRAKALLFLVGLVLMGYATVRLWPSSPDEFRADEGEGVRPGRAGPSLPATGPETRFQALVAALPPLRWLQPPPPQWRLSPAAKLMLGSVAVLLVSLAMEVVFGVA